MANVAKKYINGRLIGFHENAEELTRIAINARRDGALPKETNVAHHKDTNEVYINTDAGRLQRPLIVIKNGKSAYTKELQEKVEAGELTFSKIVEMGVIEYLDSEEEENTLVAQKEEEITKDHTHLEINGAAILSVISSMVPYVEHDMAGKALHGDKMFKQAIGFGATNYKLRNDTEYSIECLPGCIENYKTLNTAGNVAVIKTEASDELYEWTLQFIVTSAQFNIPVTNISGWDNSLHSFTAEEMYGETYNCDNVKIELHFLGYGWNETTGEIINKYEDEPEVPKYVLQDTENGIMCDTRPRVGDPHSLEPSWDFDFDGIPQSIMFKSGTPETKVYSLRKKL